MPYPGELWKERRAKPTDIYPAFRRLNVGDSMLRAFPRVEGGSRRVTQVSLNNMIAISHADYALWGIKAKWLDRPVLRLLGGGVQDRIPAYASTAGFSLSPENAAERATMIC